MQKKKYINKPLTACLSLAMIASSIAPVAATTQTITENNNVETEVTYNKASSFSVTIPKSISLGNDKQSNYSVKVEGDISSDQEVSVVPIDTLADLEGTNFYMKDQSTSNPKEDVLANITQNKTVWNFQDVADSYEETNNTISAEHLTSGTWKGSFDFQINLQTVNDKKEDDPYSTAPAEAHLNWNYTLNEEDKTITLNYYTGDETDVIVYGSYKVNGQTYQTKIASNESNSVDNYMFANKNKIKTVTFSSNADTSACTNMSYMFCNCTSLTNINFGDHFDTSNVTDMKYMFMYCSALESLDLSSFDTSNVTNMLHMFSWCGKLSNFDLSNFNTDKVTSMGSMFRGCKSLENLNLSSFNTDNAIDMDYMFCECNLLKNIDLSNFNTSKVTNMESIFYGCGSLTSIDLNNFDTSNVTNMHEMFYGCQRLATINIHNFNTGNVTDMHDMFHGCQSLTSLDLSNFNTSKVTDMHNMFQYCTSLTNLNISNFNTSNVTNMQQMFRECSSLTSLDLRSFNTSKVTDMLCIFRDCSNLKTINVTTGKWDTSNANTTYMFYYCGTSEVTYI